MQTLQELTGQESGIVIYHGNGGQPEAVVCNWSGVNGFPRVDPLGLTVLGLGEDIPATDGEPCDDLPALIADAEIVFDPNDDIPDMIPLTGTAYRLDNVLVIAPEGWC
jgi:hypothetical protein